jgi:3-hydroxyisobutyrate dehydrogenase-like beta-hydroxyacid dehydrogenase
MATIAFCGVGMMGSPMAARLQSSGHTVRIWNRTYAKAETWAREWHGVACQTPADAADPASELHLMLANDDAVDRALFDGDGALKTLHEGSLVVDHSTVSALTVEPRASRIKDGGWKYLHAPVLAGPSNVAKGEGLMLVAGSNAVYGDARTTLQQIIEKHWYIGEKERDAASFKLMANLMLLDITQALAEFFSLGRACGINPEWAMQLFEHFDPGKTIFVRGPRMARGDYAATFQASMAAKDADLMLRVAHSGGADLPGIELVQHRLLRLMKSGHGDLDLGALAMAEVHPTTEGHASPSDMLRTGGEG